MNVVTLPRQGPARDNAGEVAEAQTPRPLDDDAVRALDIRAPRYTSYPTADRFVEAFGPAEYIRYLEARALGAARPLSLYVHIPFCESLCSYCACNKVITRNHDKAPPYLRRLDRELSMVLEHLGGPRAVAQIHWGGGTPTFLRNDEIRELMRSIRRGLELAPGGEYSIEVDPRAVDDEKIAVLADEGFNRMSIGVQDFDPAVQRAVHRVQPAEMTERVLAAARRVGFESTNFDLIYGLPNQSVERFAATIAQVVRMRPERIALYNYAHLPSRFKAQRRINEASLPSAAEKLAIFDMALERLCAAGYVYIGMDHFALPDDELALAQRGGRLHRNFQGYSTHADCDLISLGASAISKVGACYAQNVRGVNEYNDTVDQGLLPVLRGIELSSEDLVRRTIIMALMCQGRLSIESIEIAYLLDFREHFAAELHALEPLAKFGLVNVDDDWITVTDKGHMALRAICAVFDRHLRKSENRSAFSRVL